MILRFGKSSFILEGGTEDTCIVLPVRLLSVLSIFMQDIIILASHHNQHHNYHHHFLCHIQVKLRR